MKILHIVDKFESGIASAIKAYINLTPKHQHFLLSRTTGTDTIESLDQLFENNWIIPSKNPLVNLKKIKKTSDMLLPHVIHLHSSLMGAYGRISMPQSYNIVYTPHCFYFERYEESTFSRKLFYFIEFILAKIANNSSIAACSHHERYLSRTLAKNVYLIPNCSPDSSIQPKNKAITPYTVCMIGRICKQKDPFFFLETYKLLNNPKIKFIWIGDGEINSKIKHEMVEAGIHVTGWLKQNQVFEILTSTEVYFHTAKWEGFPISLIEAAKYQKKIILRFGNYLEKLNLSNIVKKPNEAALLINQVISKTELSNINSDGINMSYNCKFLSNSLEDLYQSVNKNNNNSPDKPQY
jgi:glycosyltransferase involved in cell wall biosynthesis